MYSKDGLASIFYNCFDKKSGRRANKSVAAQAGTGINSNVDFGNQPLVGELHKPNAKQIKQMLSNT